VGMLADSHRNTALEDTMRGRRDIRPNPFGYTFPDSVSRSASR